MRHVTVVRARRRLAIVWVLTLPAMAAVSLFGHYVSTGRVFLFASAAVLLLVFFGLLWAAWPPKSDRVEQDVSLPSDDDPEVKAWLAQYPSERSA